ncbi:hypothetical protein FACS1894163_03300 [Spirochaetia bacterium]|nr:hypothetical protein FACS1894163_03300 [Spirochaetia bacterium]
MTSRELVYKTLEIEIAHRAGKKMFMHSDGHTLGIRLKPLDEHSASMLDPSTMKENRS